MFGNGQIFISHTHEDNPRCQPLLAALDAWQTDYWFDIQELDAGQRFSDRIQQALDQRDIFLRVTTEAAQRSFWMDRELRAVRGLRSAFPGHSRLIIHLVLAGDVARLSQSVGHGEVVIDTTRSPRTRWMHELRQALGAAVPRRVSRRTAIAAGAASVAAVATAGLAAKLFLTPPPAVANPFHPTGMAHPAPLEPGALQVRWQYSLDFNAPAESGSITGTSDRLVGLAADATAVYALSPDSQVLLAMSVGDGSIQWVYPDQSSVPREILSGHTVATAASSNNLFILSELRTIGGGSDTFNLLAVEKATGKLLWKSPNLLPQGIGGDLWSELCLVETSIYFQLDGKLYGYSQDGKPLWPAHTMFTFPSSPSATMNTPAPAFADGLIFVGTLDGRLLAVQSATGVPVWSVQVTTGLNAPVQSTPAAAGGLVYVCASDGYCYAFHAATGSLAWKTRVVNLAAYNINFITSYSAFVGAPTVSNGIVYLQAGANNYSNTLSDASLIALDAASGKQRWKVDPTKLPLHLDPKRFPTVTGITGVAPWYPSGNVIYTTLGFQTANTSGSQSELATVEALLALNQQDGSLDSYYWAPVDGQNLQSGYFPSAPVLVPGGVAFMTNEPGIYVLGPVKS
jgi:outer membrane protein assembly factor BamB